MPPSPIFYPFMVIAMPILITFAAVVLIIFLVLRYRKIREKGRYDLYVKALEAGQPLPDKFFEEPAKTSSSNLRRGAVLIAVGIGYGCSWFTGKKCCYDWNWCYSRIYRYCFYADL